jgi:hypothetical protein
MRTAIVTLMILAIAGSAIAADLGATRDQKNTSNVQYQNPVEHKQGGDTIFDAFVIPGVPYNDTGTTLGYFNDYDEVCPYTGSTAPDVVYSFTPGTSAGYNIDLCGSSYDTKLYVYDGGLNLIACNDDFWTGDPCGLWVSYLENVAMTAGTTYYVVIDGYGADAGNYILAMDYFVPCDFACPPDAVPEGEGHIYDGFVDLYNGGCNSDPSGLNYFQAIDWINVEDGNPYNGFAWMCGITGTYTSSSGGGSRDTDWFKVFAQTTGVMEMTVDAEEATYLFKLTVGPCSSVAVELSAIADCEIPATLTFPVTAGEEVWLWVGPTVFGPPLAEWNYTMYVSNNMYDVVGTDDMSFGGVKALFR